MEAAADALLKLYDDDVLLLSLVFFIIIVILIFVSSMLHQVLDNTNDREEGDDLTTHK